ncbi:MAG: metallophosphoesterase [Armatimonadota bacterium]
MIIYAIADLHLSFANPKPMDIFGPHWKDHPVKIASNWDEVVTHDDLVLVAGDTSWALKLPDAMPDLEYLAARPGRKILIRGNHDYWWGRQATNKIQRMLDPSITLLQGSSCVADGVGIAGTRGWRLEDCNLEGTAEGDKKIFDRELTYLRRGLESIPEGVSTKIAMLHYPPFDLGLRPNEFSSLLQEYRVDILVYGHIHKGTGSYLRGDVGGVRYHLASVDHTGFKPVKVWG